MDALFNYNVIRPNMCNTASIFTQALYVNINMY